MLRKFLNLFRVRREEDDSGAYAERLVAEWLRRERNFRIVASNWRSPRDKREEIDLVCRDREVLVFVEVKARAADALVPGYYAVDKRKKRVLLRATRAYLARLHPKPVTFRLDIVEVSLPDGRSPSSGTQGEAAGAGPVIRHFENVPLFSKHFRG